MNWVQRLLHRGEMESKLDKELRFHVDQHAADLISRGLDPAEARRQARITIGGPEQVKEDCRDARGTRWLEDFGQDVRFALRTMRQNPGFTMVALTTLALGIGATTVMSTVVNAVLLKPLPFPDPDRLVQVNGHSSAWNVALFGEQNLSRPDYLDLRRDVHTMDITGWVYDSATLSSPGDPEYIPESDASANLFSVYGVPLALGRAFSPEEDRAGGSPVAILGYSLWQRRYAGSAGALNSSLVLDGKKYTVIGVAPANFQPGGQEADIYTPLGQNTAPFLQRRGPHPVTTMARLNPGAAMAQAQAELAPIAARLAAQYADTNKDRTFRVRRLRFDVSEVHSTLWLLLGAVTLVLLIACANVASLLLARAVSREREFAMRVALGAGRLRLARQCLTESAVLGIAGGALGAILAVIGIRPFVAAWPGNLPRSTEILLDWRVLLFAIGVSLVSGFLFGLAPALRAPSSELEKSIRAGGRGLVGHSKRLHGTFVAAEIGLAVVLLVSAGMLGRTLLRLSMVSPGLDIHNVLTARTALSPGALTDPNRTRSAWQDLLDRVRSVPGVESVAMVDTVPMRQGNNPLGYWRTPPKPEESGMPMALANSVSSDYLKVTGIPLLRGRFFDERDRLDTQPVIVIDEVMARHAFGGGDPVGKLLWSEMGADPALIVGVVGHIRYYGPAGDDVAKVRDQFYYPFSQVPDRLVRRWSELMSIAVRTRVEPLSLLPRLRQEIRGVSGDQVLYRVRTLEQLSIQTLSQQRFLLLLFGVFAALALILACVGIYGVLAYLTSQRTPEIGVRIALGATSSAVMRMVFRQSLAMIAVGAVAGIAASLAASRVLMGIVQGMRGTEPLTLLAMTLLLIAAGLGASFIPARRASKVDPIQALRQ
jgi:predicted permease